MGEAEGKGKSSWWKQAKKLLGGQPERREEERVVPKFDLQVYPSESIKFLDQDGKPEVVWNEREDSGMPWPPEIFESRPENRRYLEEAERWANWRLNEDLDELEGLTHDCEDC